ncbi:Hypothetical predicted protein [Paramuricea clavata]|uniref:Uncharacterized protein n=1 Tax=Paramuricea clavata TaxID=317549 RepID=A0A6S7JGZ5_PARCT|nr:Hypothetical predicted protein [Paramuricea clavata]
MVTSAPVLKYFNPKDPIKVTSDSSKFGLGAVLEQREEGKWKPVAFASGSLTQSEQNYTQIEKGTISKSKLSEFATETSKDPDLQKLKNCVLNEWPDKARQVDPAVRPYYSFRDEITLYEDVLLKCDRTMVPSSLRDEMRQRIHHGHLGIEKCKARARSTLYWPGYVYCPKLEIIETWTLRD